MSSNKSTLSTLPASLRQRSKLSRLCKSNSDHKKTGRASSNCFSSIWKESLASETSSTCSTKGLDRGSSQNWRRRLRSYCRQGMAKGACKAIFWSLGTILRIKSLKRFMIQAIIKLASSSICPFAQPRSTLRTTTITGMLWTNDTWACRCTQRTSNARSETAMKIWYSKMRMRCTSWRRKLKCSRSAEMLWRSKSRSTTCWAQKSGPSMNSQDISLAHSCIIGRRSTRMH